MLRVPFETLRDAVAAALRAHGAGDEKALACATLFAETTCDGVYTHGLNRLPRLMAMMKNGSVLPNESLERVQAHAALEQWNGRRGFGNLNALAATDRAMELATEYGIGCVALRNTNHWMRGGTYGWHAAERGFFGLCWTNTNPNLPAWGTTGSTLGNNPLVLAAPRLNPATNTYAGGEHVVVDTAMSQFSYGQIDAHIARGAKLPVPGGYDVNGVLTDDPQLIRESYRALPIGFWKGSGLAMMLDLFAAMLSGGKTSHEIHVDPVFETGLSQMFLAIAPQGVAQTEQMTATVNGLIEALHTAPRSDAAVQPRYPGEQMLRIREENLRLGVPVDEKVWAATLAAA